MALVPAVDQNGTGALQWLTGCMRSNSEHKVEQHGSVLGTTKIGPGDEVQVFDNTLLLTLQPFQLNNYNFSQGTGSTLAKILHTGYAYLHSYKETYIALFINENYWINNSATEVTRPE